jgi:hypothetical protein
MVSLEAAEEGNQQGHPAILHLARHHRAQFEYPMTEEGAVLVEVRHRHHQADYLHHHPFLRNEYDLLDHQVVNHRNLIDLALLP